MSMSMSAGPRHALLASLLAFTFTACDDGTAPVVDFDAGPTAEALQDMMAVTDGMEDAMAGLGLAMGQFGVIAFDQRADPFGMLAALPMPDVTGVISGDFFPPEQLGRSFVWDPDTESYIPGEAVEGLENGIRLFYYTVDPLTMLPALPLEVLGYIDLRDLSTASSDRLGVVIVREAGGAPVTLADYYTDMELVLTPSAFNMSVGSVGYLSNGIDRLNFDMAMDVAYTESTLTARQTLALELEGTGTAASLDMTVSGDAGSELFTVEMVATLTNGAEQVAFEVSIDENERLDGRVRHQGAVIALISGHAENPTFTDVNGDPLTREQLEDLETLWEGLNELFGLAAGVGQL